ncbi:MAG: hypothetical protein IJS32_08195, partial [Kiritimatiellae bacterium]|nr:hypothetical protein [Kiritimatiellia bacterium]
MRAVFPICQCLAKSNRFCQALAKCAVLALFPVAPAAFAQDPADGLVLGEEDLAERAEIARNLFRRITPGNDPFVQDAGTWPALWEAFGANWAAAAAGRGYGAWVVPVSVSQENGA